MLLLIGPLGADLGQGTTGLGLARAAAHLSSRLLLEGHGVDNLEERGLGCGGARGAGAAFVGLSHGMRGRLAVALAATDHRADARTLSGDGGTALGVGALELALGGAALGLGTHPLALGLLTHGRAGRLGRCASGLAAKRLALGATHGAVAGVAHVPAVLILVAHGLALRRVAVAVDATLGHGELLGAQDTAAALSLL